MNFKNTLITASAAVWIAVSPAIAQVQNETSGEVFQLVWQRLIPTDSETIQQYKTIWCKEFNGNKIYISQEADIIQTWFFFDISKKSVNKILSAPDCQ